MVDRNDTSSIELKLEKISEVIAEKNKTPWFKRVSNLIAITALSISLITSYTTYKIQQISVVRSAMDSLERRVVTLSQMRTVAINLVERKQRGVNVTAKLQELKVSEQFMIDEAKRIIRLFPDEVTYGTYWIMAQRLSSNREYDHAIKYLQKSLEISDSDEDKIGAIRLLGNVNMEKGYKVQMESATKKGRNFYKNALTISPKNATKMELKKIQAKTLFHWALDEFRYGTKEFGFDKLGQSKKLLVSLPTSYSNVEELLEKNERLRKQELNDQSKL